MYGSSVVNMQRFTDATYSFSLGFILIFQNLYSSCLFSVLTTPTHGLHGWLGAVLLVYRSILVLNVAKPRVSSWRTEARTGSNNTLWFNHNTIRDALDSHTWRLLASDLLMTWPLALTILCGGRCGFFIVNSRDLAMEVQSFE